MSTQRLRRTSSSIALIALVEVLSALPSNANAILVSENLSTASYSASSVYLDRVPPRAFDGNFSTEWNAGAYTGWIEAHLGQSYVLSRIEMTLDLSPNGHATYQVWVSHSPIQGDTSNATMVREFTGSFSDGDLLVHSFVPLTTVRHVQVRTADSVGWAAWAEIQIFASTLTCAPPAEDLAAWWSGDGDADDRGGENDGTLVGGTSFAAGVVDSAFLLDGVDDYVEIGDATALEPPSLESITMMAWINRAGPATGSYPNLQVIVGRAGLTGSPTSDGYYLRWDDGRAAFNLVDTAATGTALVGSTPLSDGTWYHIAGSFESASRTMRLYVNGVLEGVVSTPGGLPSNAVPWRIGHSSFPGVEEPFNGLIDEVQVYGVALDAASIQEIVDAGPFGVCTCVDLDNDGFFYESGCGTEPDCNNADPGTYPGAQEICDGFDNDCDGQLDASPMCDTDCDHPELIGERVQLTDNNVLDREPSLAWTGDGFGVAWVGIGGGGQTSQRIQFARLGVSGQQIGETLILEADPPQARGAPTLVWTGSEYAVVWFQGDTDLYFARIDSLGNRIGGDVPITTADDAPRQPLLRWIGSGYALVWTAIATDFDREVFFALLDVAGNVTHGPLRVSPAIVGADYPSIVWTGAEFGVTWEDERSGFQQTFFARLTPSGTTLDESSLYSGQSRSPALAWNSSEYAVVWDDVSGQLLFSRIAADGNPIGVPVQVFVPGSGIKPERTSLTWSGTEYGLTWYDDSDGSPDYSLLRLSPTGVTLEGASEVGSAVDSVSRFPLRLIWLGALYAAGLYQHGEGPVTNTEIVFSRIGCNCFDNDGDDVTLCNDCDDDDGSTSPGAPQLCDGINNDCDDPSWPAVPADEADDDVDGIAQCEGDCDDTDEHIYPGAAQECDGSNNDCDAPGWPEFPGTNEADDDGDGLSECAGDCDDTRAGVYPDAPQVCDGLNNNCNHPSWPSVIDTNEQDDDSDSLSECAGDCDDSDSSTFPGAPQQCDGRNNDCSNPAWPAVPPDEADADADGHRGCAGDCNDTDSDVSPEATEVCNGVDDNCNELTDEDAFGEDSDDDGDHNMCDNCRDAFNPDQADTDGDSHGNVCDNCVFVANDQEDLDSDDRGDVCDNCPESYNPYQDDLEADGVGDVCDNCFDVPNPSQSDLDEDWEGDHCDLDDGVIYITFNLKSRVRWQEEIGYVTWNVYRGDLGILRETGTYTQAPGSNDLAHQACGLTQPSWGGIGVPEPDHVAFFLVTGVNSGSAESNLGFDSEGSPRPNENPCP